MNDGEAFQDGKTPPDSDFSGRNDRDEDNCPLFITIKGRAFGSPLARGFYPRASTAEVDPLASQGPRPLLGGAADAVTGRETWHTFCIKNHV